MAHAGSAALQWLGLSFVACTLPILTILRILKHIKREILQWKFSEYIIPISVLKKNVNIATWMSIQKTLAVPKDSKNSARYSKLFETLKANSRIKKGTFPVATNLPFYFQNRNIQGSKHFYSLFPQVRVLLVSLPSELSNQKISFLPVYILPSLIWNSSRKVTYKKARAHRV